MTFQDLKDKYPDLTLITLRKMLLSILENWPDKGHDFMNYMDPTFIRQAYDKGYIHQELIAYAYQQG